MTRRILQVLVSLCLLWLAGAPSSAIADTASGSQTVGHVLIYMGLLPAEMVRGHPKQHPEASMHSGVPAGSGEYHLIIALFDAGSRERITKAEIRASVSEIGLAGKETKLEPMELAGAITFGNYVRMAGNGPFRIDLAIRFPDEPHEIKVVFEHKHQ
jgi:hypothetical protein